MDKTLFDRLRPIGFTTAHAGNFDAAGTRNAWLARVVQVHRETFALDDGLAQLPARLHPPAARALADAGDAIAVGDRAVAVRDDDGGPWIAALLPRACWRIRADDEGRRRELVANVDAAFVVMGLDGDFNARRAERYLALAHGAGAWPIVVLTKHDCAAAAATSIDEVHRRLSASIPIETVNALAPGTAMQRAPYLPAGQAVVLLGSSGAGKSTLASTLLGHAAQRTGDVRADSRGRHTTTARMPLRLPTGACLIDTPGLRGLCVDVNEAPLTASSVDIADLALRCRFRDCRHQGTPGCAVRAGVAPDRLHNFHKLAREMQHERMTYLDRRRQLAERKSRSKAAAQRMRMKRC